MIIPGPSGGGGGGGVSGFFVARLSANQTSNVAVNNHIEFDIEGGSGIGSVSGTRIATLATGSGQADGLVTIEGDGIYRVSFGGRFLCNEGYANWSLVDDDGDALITDLAGVELVIRAQDDYGTDSTARGHAASQFELSDQQVIKIELTSEQNCTQVRHEYTTLEILKLA